jgi:pimeloyl-ACP methyl ester carboxylesterase
MELRKPKDYWYSFRDACVAVTESTPTSTHYSGSPIFFLHGRFGHGEMWKAVAQGFAAQSRCLTVDLPGFGRSIVSQDRGFFVLEHVDLIHELLQRWVSSPHERATLVAHDVGGAIALLTALKCPEKVSSIVLINSAGLTRELPKILAGFRGWRTHWKLQQILGEAETIPIQSKESMLLPWKSRSARKSLFQSVRAFDESWPLHYERQTWKNGLKTITQPVLLLWGKRDLINPPDIAVELMQQLPEAYFFLDENSGHWPCLEQPEWVISKMKEFLFRIQHQTIRSAQKFLSR